MLLSGRHRGFAIDDKALIFAAESCLERGKEGRCVYQAPLALVLSHGTGYSPFSIELFDEIAQLATSRSKGFSEGLPATRQAARLARPFVGSEADALIARLRKAIEEDPEEGALYLLLGAVYEKSSVPNSERYAQACYREAQSLRSWGHVNTAAKAALERLEGEE